jgi:predicted transcriptional regulator
VSSDTANNKAPREGTEKTKKPFQIARERRGGVPKVLIERNREQMDIRKKIIKALKEGPKTAPELATAVGLETEVAFWWLMALRKYGDVVEGAASGDYIQYELKKDGGEENK